MKGRFFEGCREAVTAPLLAATLLAAGSAAAVERVAVEVPGAPAPKGPYSHAIKYGDLLFIAGQIPVDPKTQELVTGPIEEQARRVMENIKLVLAANGMTMANVLSTTVYLKDFGDFAKMNAVYATYFSAAPPARATVPVTLPGSMLIEISAIAGR